MSEYVAPTVAWQIPAEVEVVAVEQGYSVHPNPSQNGRIVAITGLSKLLLSDGSELSGCDSCGYTHENPRSVIGHMPMHSERAKSFYPDEKLSTIFKVVRKYRSRRIRGYCEAAAAELNRRKILDHRGEAWNASQISSLFRDHNERILEWENEQRKARVTAANPTSSAAPTQYTPPVVETQRETRPANSGTVTTRGNVPAILRRVADELTSAAQSLQVAAKMAEQDKTPKVDEAELRLLREKAAKFDALKGIMQ